MKISASLVVYQNAQDQLLALLQSLSASSLHVHLVVIDNSPTPALAPLFGSHDYHWTGKNLGFGKGHNLAVERLKESSLHLILNPDVSFPSDAIERLAAFMQANPEVACSVPRVLYPDGKIQRLCKLLPTPANLLVRRFLPGLAARLDHDYEMQFFDYAQTVEIPTASGCFMVIRTENYRAVGGFDPRFFMYLEDVDLSRRLAQVGKVIFYPEVSIYHTFAKSSYKNKKLLLAHIRSTCQYFNKWGWFVDRQRSHINRNTRHLLGNQQRLR